MKSTSHASYDQKKNGKDVVQLKKDENNGHHDEQLSSHDEFLPVSIDKDEARKRGQDILSRLITSSLPRDTPPTNASGDIRRQGDEGYDDRLRTNSMDSAYYGSTSSSFYGAHESGSGGGGKIMTSNSSASSQWSPDRTSNGEDKSPTSSPLLRRGSLHDAMDAIRMVQQAMSAPEQQQQQQQPRASKSRLRTTSMASASSVTSDVSEDDMMWEKMDRELVS
jgi:hypothetical protein